jgi:hypothetical protein
MSEAGVANPVYNVQDKEKPMAVRNANILAARGLNYQCVCSLDILLTNMQLLLMLSER